MFEEYELELPYAEELAKGAAEVVRVAGVRNLNMESAQQLGYYDRIGHLLALMACLADTADRVYDNINCMLMDFGVKKHEIKRECAAYEKAFDRFFNFWLREGYLKKKMESDINTDCEELYHMAMKWARLPETWQLGDEQRVTASTEALIQLDLGKKYLKFRRAIDSCTDLEEPAETWCVTRLDSEAQKQYVVHDRMSKADAMMVAKRLSAEHPDIIFTATTLTTKVQRIVESTPMKVYMNNQVVGDVKRVLKKNGDER